jgi:hypothetical protein
MNFDLKVKDISLETYILTGNINNQEIINNLINFIKNSKNTELSYKTHVKGHFTGFKSLIENVDFIDFLKKIQPQIKIIFKENFIITDAWGNILKKNEEITEHSHGNKGFSGILYLTDDGPGTYFKEYNLLIKEEIGKFILFTPILLHSVPKVDKDIERITVAFNMTETKEWYDMSNIKWANRK